MEKPPLKRNTFLNKVKKIFLNDHVSIKFEIQYMLILDPFLNRFFYPYKI